MNLKSVSEVFKSGFKVILGRRTQEDYDRRAKEKNEYYYKNTLDNPLYRFLNSKDSDIKIYKPEDMGNEEIENDPEL